MKKILLSLALIAIFIIYAVEQHLHPVDSIAPETANTQSTTQSQTTTALGQSTDIRPGQLVNINGTIYLVNSSGLLGFPSVAVLNSWGYNLNNVSPANSAEQALSMLAVVPEKTNADCASPINQMLKNCSAVAVAAPLPTVAGEYKDGQYTGSVANSVFGNVQVLAVISGGKLTDIQFVQFPDEPGHTTQVTNRAEPQLKTEAIAAQSANVDIVSGATQDSHAFQQSLADALSQAKS
jgi:uncharacterized protein with FMN-binding domain